jgi:hypothetical protein
MWLDVTNWTDNLAIREDELGLFNGFPPNYRVPIMPYEWMIMTPLKDHEDIVSHLWQTTHLI